MAGPPPLTHPRTGDDSLRFRKKRPGRAGRRPPGNLSLVFTGVFCYEAAFTIAGPAASGRQTAAAYQDKTTSI